MSQVLPTSPLCTAGSGVADLNVCDSLVQIYGIGGRDAMAVALGNNPKVLSADEPTGELDSATAQEVLGVPTLAGEDWASPSWW